MKKIIFGIFFFISLTSCASNTGFEQENYNFDNFKETPLWNLAQAIREDDYVKVREILQSKSIDINFKDPKFKQTLLVLSIENKKEKSFLELLNAGANPNELVGQLNDATALLSAIQTHENCNLFYVENLLKHRANPNLEINIPEKDRFFINSFPLLAAIQNIHPNGIECLSLVKLLVNSGADINYCYQNPQTGLCEGVINKCLKTMSMEELRYFVIEKNIIIPDKVYIVGGINKATQKQYGLREILQTEDYKFDNTTPRLKRAKEDILKFLKQNEK